MSFTKSMATQLRIQTSGFWGNAQLWGEMRPTFVRLLTICTFQILTFNYVQRPENHLSLNPSNIITYLPRTIIWGWIQVLSALGVDCEFLGALGTDQLSEFVIKRFEELRIKFHNCPRFSHIELPNSAIVINRHNGSRTILHSNQGRNLPQPRLSMQLKIYIGYT